MEEFFALVLGLNEVLYPFVSIIENIELYVS